MGQPGEFQRVPIAVRFSVCNADSSANAWDCSLYSLDWGTRLVLDQLPDFLLLLLYDFLLLLCESDFTLCLELLLKTLCGVLRHWTNKQSNKEAASSNAPLLSVEVVVVLSRLSWKPQSRHTWISIITTPMNMLKKMKYPSRMKTIVKMRLDVNPKTSSLLCRSVQPSTCTT